jgi:hypothetical protein
VITIYKDLVTQLFGILFSFIRRYTNSSYCVGLYLNMNRVIKAEIDLNEANKGLKTALRLIAFCKFQNLGMTGAVAAVWLKKGRNRLQYKNKREEFNKNGY